MYQVALGLQTLQHAEAVAALAQLCAQAGGREVHAETPAVGVPPARRAALDRATRGKGRLAPRGTCPKLARLITARLGDCMLRNPN